MSRIEPEIERSLSNNSINVSLGLGWFASDFGSADSHTSAKTEIESLSDH